MCVCVCDVELTGSHSVIASITVQTTTATSTKESKNMLVSCAAGNTSSKMVNVIPRSVANTTFRYR